MSDTQDKKAELQEFLCNSLESLGVDETVTTISELLVSIAHKSGQDLTINVGDFGSVTVSPKLTTEQLDS